MVVFIVVPKNSGLREYREIALSELDVNTSRILEVRGEDVPFWVKLYLDKGKKAIGLTGEDLYKEYSLATKNNICILKKIEWKDTKTLFGKPSLCLLGPKNKKLEKKEKLAIFIAAKYKNIAEEYLKQLENKGYSFEKSYINGCVETGCSEGMADLIIDIVYSGSSIEKYGLKVYDKIMKSDFLIIGEKND